MVHHFGMVFSAYFESIALGVMLVEEWLVFDGGKASPAKSSSHTDRLIKPGMEYKVSNSHVTLSGEIFLFVGASARKTFFFAFKLEGARFGQMDQGGG